MKPIASEWASFDQFIVPVDASDVQRREMKRAFYAGAAAMLSIITGPVTSATEQAAVQMIKDMQLECRVFALDVEEGKA